MAGEIWWADVIRASRALGVTSDSDFARVARLLGFDPRGASERPTTRPPWGVPPDGPATTDMPEPGARPEPAPPPAARPAAATAGVPLVPISTEPILADLPTGPVLARPSPRPSAPRPHLSLLAPRSTTAILQYLLSRLVADGPVDVAAVIEQIAAGRPLPTLPRRPQRTLRFGAEILVDLGEHMRPFRRDQADVVAAARAVVGVGSSSVRYFADAPLRGIGPGRRAGWTPGYSPPAAGTAVLLLTDLGIGGDRLSLERASVPEWLRFLRLVGRAGCRPVALVPYPPERWPSRLRALCPMLTWDRDVTVGTARTAVP